MWGGQGGSDYDNYNEVIQELRQKRSLTEEQAKAELDKVQGPNRYPHLVFLATRNNFLLTTALEASGVVRAGNRDALHDMLVAHIANGDPKF
jgi:hypothetical protein